MKNFFLANAEYKLIVDLLKLTRRARQELVVQAVTWRKLLR